MANFQMNTFTIVMLIILGVLIVAVVLLYIFGKKAQKKQDEQNAQLQANKQYVSLLIIDKKKLKVKDSGLPQAVIDQTPKYLRGTKLPIVKVKVGPQMMNMICDDKIYDDLPIKKEVKAGVSGLYLLEVKGLHGKAPVAPAKKKNKFKAWVEKMQEKAGAKPL